MEPGDIEALAAAEHESWQGWTDYMLKRVRRELAEAFPFGPWGDDRATGAIEAFDGLPCVKRWTRQMATPYAELPDNERESDRIEARKKLSVYRPVQDA